MPKISLADQLDTLKGKMGGMFKRSPKSTAEKAASDTGEEKQSQLKRMGPLVLVAALLGGGYTFQNEIMSMAFPPAPLNKPAPLPVARVMAPAPAPVAVETVAAAESAVNEPALESAVIEPSELESRKALSSAEIDAIDRKLLALKELDAMENRAPEEKAAAPVSLAMETEEEMPQNSPSHEEMMAMVNNDTAEVATAPVAEEQLNDPLVMHNDVSQEARAESMAANQWTMWQASHQWAVQLMAVQTKEYLADFIARNELEEGATYFEFNRDGAHFYALVMGVYDTHREARTAAQELATTLNVEPWVRSMRSIQNVISYDLDAEEPTLTLSQLAPAK